MIIDSLQEGYEQVGKELLRGGAITRSRVSGASPRTREVVGYSLTVLDPRRSLPIGCGRNLNPAIGAVEALQLVGGWSDPNLQCSVSANMKAFMDAGIFHGAYGLRVAQQIPNLIKRLRSDASSRQGVLTIWDPLRDGQDGPKDLPCTVALQFLIRNDELHCIATMRSNDYWWGLAYDVFQFTQLQMTLAHFLSLDIGRYHHSAGSFHTYERDWEAVDALYPYDGKEHPNCPGFAYDLDKSWEDIRARTRQIVGEGDAVNTTAHAWYVDVMKPYTPEVEQLRRAIQAENAMNPGLPD